MPWRPMQRLPQEQVSEQVLVQMAAEQGEEIEVWGNGRYEVFVRTQEPPGAPVMKHLSINTHDRGPVRNWRHLQQIKNEICGELWTGVEFFPPEDKLVDTANQYHLFCFDPSADFAFGLGSPDEAIVTDDEMVEAFNDNPHPGRQEPWEEGLTTGRSEHSDESRERLREALADPSRIKLELKPSTTPSTTKGTQ